MFCDYVVNILFTFGPICFGQRTTILSMLYCTLCMNNALFASCLDNALCISYVLLMILKLCSTSCVDDDTLRRVQTTF